MPSALMNNQYKILLPDLIAYSNFTPRMNAHYEEVSAASRDWILQADTRSPKSTKATFALNGGLLAGLCYPDAPSTQFRVVCDFLNYVFHLDDITDDMDMGGARSLVNEIVDSLYYPSACDSPMRFSEMAGDFWSRAMPIAAPGVQRRFLKTFEKYMRAVVEEADLRQSGTILDLESYIALRRDTSGCQACWAMIEYGNSLEIPDEVMDYPLLRRLGETTNDYVMLANDIFSFNSEQSRGDPHNAVIIVMAQQGLGLQEAIDYVGNLCKATIDGFKEDRNNLPSWGPKIDKDVATYVEGLAMWIIGLPYWSFYSERYFGKSGRDALATHTMDLLPPHPRHKHIFSLPNDTARRLNELPSPVSQ